MSWGKWIYLSIVTGLSVSASYAVFNFARGFCWLGGVAFSFSRASRVTHFRLRKSRRAKEKKYIKINKREIKFLLLLLGTFLISCVFCQDKLNFYERRRRRRRRKEIAKGVAAPAAAAAAAAERAKTLNFSHLVKFILSQVITL